MRDVAAEFAPERRNLKASVFADRRHESCELFRAPAFAVLADVLQFD